MGLVIEIQIALPCEKDRYAKKWCPIVRDRIELINDLIMIK
jgi:hypothetical protein